MRTETKKEILEIKKDLANFGKSNVEKTEGIYKQLGQIERKCAEKWKGLELRLKLVEEKEERRLKIEKKNNVIIKEATGNVSSSASARQVTRDTLKEIGFDKQIVDAHYIGRGVEERKIIRVQLTNFDDKMTILKNKNKLKNTERFKNTFIENDLTKQDREIQAAIRHRAREERSKGHEVRIGYHKLQVNGQWEYWENHPDFLHTEGNLPYNN